MPSDTFWPTLGESAGDRVVSHRAKRGWALGLCIAVLRPPLMLLTKRDWRGAANLPKHGGCIVAVNHISHFDPVVIGHFIVDHGRLPRFLGKVELFRVPVLGSVLSSAGQIPVHRRLPDAASAFSAAVVAVEAGECVIIYPEGTITRDPRLWPMRGKSGTVRIALATGCPVVPVAQWGAQDVLAPYSRRLRLLPRKTIRVLAGPPVDLSDLVGRQITPALLAEGSGRVTTAIAQLLGELRGEPAPASVFDPGGRAASAAAAEAEPPAEEGIG